MFLGDIADVEPFYHKFVHHCALFSIWISFHLWNSNLAWLLRRFKKHCFKILKKKDWTHLLNLMEERMWSGPKSLAACDRWRHQSVSVCVVYRTYSRKKMVIQEMWRNLRCVSEPARSANLCAGLCGAVSDCKRSAPSPHTPRTRGERHSGPTGWTGSTSLKIWAAEAC